MHGSMGAGGNQANRAHSAARPRRLSPTRPTSSLAGIGGLLDEAWTSHATSRDLADTGSAARQRASDCSLGVKLIFSKRADCREPADGGVHADGGVAVEKDEVRVCCAIGGELCRSAIGMRKPPRSRRKRRADDPATRPRDATARTACPPAGGLQTRAGVEAEVGPIQLDAIARDEVRNCGESDPELLLRPEAEVVLGGDVRRCGPIPRFVRVIQREAPDRAGGLTAERLGTARGEATLRSRWPTLVPTHDRVVDPRDAGRPGCCHRSTSAVDRFRSATTIPFDREQSRDVDDHDRSLCFCRWRAPRYRNGDIPIAVNEGHEARSRGLGSGAPESTLHR